MSTIHTTTDYGRFQYVKGNRSVKRAHVNKLRTIFGLRPEVAEWVPIIVNEKDEIIDGQHRFEACKALEFPVYYRVIPGLTLEDVQALNSNTKAWVPDDYANAYATNGNRHYANYIKFKKHFGLNHDTVMQYVALDNPVTGESFKHGRFKSGNQTLSWRYADQLMELGQYVTHYKFRATAIAFLRMCMHPLYDHSRMIEKAKLHGHAVERFTTHEEAILALSKVYNHGLPESKKMNFLFEE